MSSGSSSVVDQAIRAHGNFAEHAPLALLVIALAEMLGAALGSEDAVAQAGKVARAAAPDRQPRQRARHTFFDDAVEFDPVVLKLLNFKSNQFGGATNGFLIPTSDPAKNYQWGTMEGGSTAGYFAIRMKSDIIYETQYNGATTQEKYCVRPGLYCGLILLTSIENGEFLAFINDGHLQHMRVAGDGGIGVKYMANEEAEVVGMLGSGGMARTHMQAFTRVRTIKKLQVYSPTKDNREAFGREMAAKYNIEVKVCDNPEDIYKGAQIVADNVWNVLGPVLERQTSGAARGRAGREDHAAGGIYCDPVAEHASGKYRIGHLLDPGAPAIEGRQYRYERLDVHSAISTQSSAH